jgi:hypothetical protein
MTCPAIGGGDRFGTGIHLPANLRLDDRFLSACGLNCVPVQLTTEAAISAVEPVTGDG